MTLRVSTRLGLRLTVAISEALCVPLPSMANEAWFDHCRASAFTETDPDRFAWEYLRVQCFSKFRGLGDVTDEDRRSSAYSDLQKSEEDCANANSRLVEWWSRAHLDEKVWKRARALCERILGRLELREEFYRGCNFGPGASTGIKRIRACHQNKWVLATHATERAIPYVSAFHNWARMRQLNRFAMVVPGNRVTTVPKSWKKDRTIAIEPDWNMFLQKGIGVMIRRRLQAYGLLQNNAQEINSGLARLGSATGLLATLDMSRASDSVSMALCEALLPDSWRRVIFDLRCERGMLNGRSITYEKVSSMGNGFTFELETLLFYVLVCASSRKENWDRIFVYGDDIICATSDVPKVMETLRDAGFALNTDKSFWTGGFRESCGGHWFDGRDVTPFYVREVPTHVGDLIVHSNAMTRFVHNRPPGEPHPFEDVGRLMKRQVPRKYRGPLGMDGVLWSNWDEACPRWVPKEQRYDQSAFTKRPVGVKKIPFRYGALLAALWNGPSDDAEVRMSRLPRREYVYKPTSVAIDREQWYAFNGIC